MQFQWHSHQDSGSTQSEFWSHEWLGGWCHSTRNQRLFGLADNSSTLHQSRIYWSDIVIKLSHLTPAENGREEVAPKATPWSRQMLWSRGNFHKMPFQILLPLTAEGDPLFAVGAEPWLPNDLCLSHRTIWRSWCQTEKHRPSHHRSATMAFRVRYYRMF